jgi:hypothetical protein
MPETSEQARTGETSRKVTRRKFILGVIAGGGAIAAANYRLITSVVHEQASPGERPFPRIFMPKRRESRPVEACCGTPRLEARDTEASR